MSHRLHDYMLGALLGWLSTSIWAWGNDFARLLLALGLAVAGLVTAGLYLLYMLRHSRLNPPSRADDQSSQLSRAAIRTAAIFLLVFYGLATALAYRVYGEWKPDDAANAPAQGQSNEPQATGPFSQELPTPVGELPTPNATHELAKQVADLAAAIRALPASAPAQQPASSRINGPDTESNATVPTEWARDARLELPLFVRLWASVLSAAVLGLLVWLALRALGARRAIAAVPALALSAAAGGFSFKVADKVSIERLLDCRGKPCLSVQLGRGTAPNGLRALTPSPAFAVGAGLIGAPGSGCLGDENSGKAWVRWQRDWLNAWGSRHQPSAGDVVVLVGSADRQVLSVSLQRDFESNTGLARARAEAVREFLLAATAALPDERHRLTSQRILVLTSGPAYTGAPLLSRSPACDDSRLRDDRRVQVWLQAARQP